MLVSSDNATFVEYYSVNVSACTWYDFVLLFTKFNIFILLGPIAINFSLPRRPLKS